MGEYRDRFRRTTRGVVPAADTVGTAPPPRGQRGALTTLQGWRGRRAVGVVPAADTVGTEAPTPCSAANITMAPVNATNTAWVHPPAESCNGGDTTGTARVFRGAFPPPTG